MKSFFGVLQLFSMKPNNSLKMLPGSMSKKEFSRNYEISGIANCLEYRPAKKVGVSCEKMKEHIMCYITV